MLNKIRCDWPGADEQMIKYHDEEWGAPVHDDIKWFEFITLDAFQAGLSWSIVLKKRENFRNAFDNFDPKKIANYYEDKYNELVNNAGIIRNRAKIRATINNAKAFLTIQEEFGTFDKFIWGFFNNKPIINKWKSTNDIPAKTADSDRLSKELIDRGFKFVGSTICYAFMQGAGVVNDHLAHCFRYDELTK